MSNMNFPHTYKYNWLTMCTSYKEVNNQVVLETQLKKQENNFDTFLCFC